MEQETRQTQQPQAKAPNWRETAWPVIIGLALMFTLVLLQFSPDYDAQAAPPAAPTPVANILTSDRAQFFRFQPTTLITQDTNTTAMDLLGYNSLDISITADHEGTEPNTTTLTLQYSNDNSNWADGAFVFSASSTDTTEMTRFPIFGRYVRIEQDVTNTNDVTFTLLAVAR